jgi:CheY-like chemotaxis protein
MGGSIGVESAPGKGSTFWFELALERSTACVVEREALPAQFSRLRALVVDDMPMNLELMARQLHTLGIKAHCEDDGFAALAELERAWHRGAPYDVLFLDQMMPALSGDGVARKLMDMPHLADTKVVIVSSVGRDMLRTGELKLDAVLEKPLRQQELLNCLVNLYAAKSAAPKAPARPVAQGLSVLLAEDNKINQQVAVALLGKWGHHVVVAGNGHEAVDAVRKGGFDVVLMDIQMPELDGVQATKQIRNLAPPLNEIPIIAMTAHAMAGAREEYLAAGMNDYISKPIQPALLEACLKNIAAGAAPVIVEMPSRPAQDSAPILDTHTLDELGSVLSPARLEEMIAAFIADAETKVSDIAALRAEKAFDDIAKLAHNLVSSAGNLGAMRACYLARDLEQRCRRRETADTYALISRLSRACEAAGDGMTLWARRRAARMLESA